jgi:phage repressor protein C with HTH and peptisase S24 domain
MVRRIVGSSMSPRLEPGQVVIASGWFSDLRAGEVCIFLHGGKEKIKRIERATRNRVFFIGDNLEFSSDSRHFGWVLKSAVLAKVIWPRVHN